MELRLRKFGGSDTFVPADHETALKVGKMAEMVVVAKVPSGRRSLGQNDLYQVWGREFAAYLLKKPEKEVTAAEHEDMKYTLQRRCYAETGWPFLLTEQTDLVTGDKRKGRRSTADFEQGEMHQFLDWVQYFASERGLILEARGEYAELKAHAA